MDKESCKCSRTGIIYKVADFGKMMGKFDEAKISTCCTAYNDSKSKKTTILVYGQMLFFGTALKTSFCPPNQYRAAGLVVDDVPKQFSMGNSLHGIYFPDEGLTIPLRIWGIMSYIPICLPTEEEMGTCCRVRMP